jgi:hypothetical protein
MFENRVLRRGRKQQGAGEICMTMSVRMFTPRMIKSGRMSWAGHGAREEWMKRFSRKAKKRENLEDLGVDGRIVVK